MNVISALRYILGERPGMKAGARAKQHFYFYHPIAIQTQVRLADVSFYQDRINFQIMKPLLDGVIIRAGQRTWVDIRFRENWAKAKEARVLRGSYWFYDSREDPKRQAALWWSLIKDDPGELVHAADFEESYGGPYGSPASMRTFLEEFQRLSGLPDERIVIYTGYYWWGQRVGNNLFFRRFPLWLAWYASMPVVRVPLPWIEEDLLFWQYTPSGDGTLYGVTSLEIDLNWYCCDMASFSKRFGLGASEPPPAGGTMWSGKTNQVAKLWREPGVNQFEDLPSGVSVTGDAPRPDGYVYLRTPIPGYTKKIWLSNYVEIPVPPPPPPPPPDPEPPPAHVVEVYIDGALVFRKELL